MFETVIKTIGTLILVSVFSIGFGFFIAVGVDIYEELKSWFRRRA